jgi:hypothetical protein
VRAHVRQRHGISEKNADAIGSDGQRHPRAFAIEIGIALERLAAERSRK